MKTAFPPTFPSSATRLPLHRISVPAPAEPELTPAWRRPGRSHTTSLIGQCGGMQDSPLAKLTATFERLGADDPVEWAHSEITEDIPQLARFLALRLLWRVAIDPWTDDDQLNALPAAQRLLAAGADRTDLVRLARAAAYTAVHTTLYRMDEGYDPEVEDADSMPGWTLMETTDDGERLTGRTVGGLYESILTMDPSGREGCDLWE